MELLAWRSAARWSILGFLVVLGGERVGSAANAQLATFPSWYGQNLHNGTASPVPQLASADGYFLDVQPGSMETKLRTYTLTSYAESGVLAVTTGIDPVVGLDTGLARVLWMGDLLETASGGAVEEKGVIVGGIRVDGQSQIRAAEWSAGMPASTVTFADCTPAHPTKVYLSGVAVDGELYCFEGGGHAVEHWFDSDANGIPDATGLYAPLVLERAPWSSLVRGIAFSGGYYLESLGLAGTYLKAEVVKTSGGLNLLVSDHQGGVPYFYTNTLVAGMRLVWVGWKSEGKFTIKRPGGHEIGAGRIPRGGGRVLVTLDESLKVDEVIRLEAESGPSSYVKVVPSCLHALPIEPRIVPLNNIVTIIGSNFDSSVHVTSRWGSTGAFSPVLFSVDDPNRIAVKLPNARPLGEHVFVVRIQRIDQGGAVLEEAMTNVHVY